jgi:hypothetical protein
MLGSGDGAGTVRTVLETIKGSFWHFGGDCLFSNFNSKPSDHLDSNPGPLRRYSITSSSF